MLLLLRLLPRLCRVRLHRATAVTTRDLSLRRWREEEQDRRDGGAFAFAFGSPLSAPPLKLTYHRSRSH